MTLQDLRVSHKLTQEEIVKCTGLPYNTYRHYEYGDTFPSPKAIVSLAKLYDMPPGELFEQLCREKGLIPPTA